MTYLWDALSWSRSQENGVVEADARLRPAILVCTGRYLNDTFYKWKALFGGGLRFEVAYLKGCLEV